MSEGCVLRLSSHGWRGWVTGDKEAAESSACVLMHRADGSDVNRAHAHAHAQAGGRVVYPRWAEGQSTPFLSISLPAALGPQFRSVSVNLHRAVPVGCAVSLGGAPRSPRFPAAVVNAYEHRLCFAKLKRSFQLRALVHDGRHPFDSHPLTLSRPPPPQSAVSLPTLAAAAATACAGVADVHPACRSRLSLGATAIAAAHAPVRRPDAPGPAERMELLQQGIPRSALDRFRQGRHSQARLESAGRQQVAIARPPRRALTTT